MTRVLAILTQLILFAILWLVWIWPAFATTLEATNAVASLQRELADRGWTRCVGWLDGLPGSQTVLDSRGQTAGVLLDPSSSRISTESAELPRPIRLAAETLGLVIATQILAIPIGCVLAWMLVRTNSPGSRVIWVLLGLAAFIPLPLHATAWLGAFGNAGRVQAFGSRPILVGRFGAAVVYALAAIPWVTFVVSMALRGVERELEEAARFDHSPRWVALRVTFRRSLGGIAAAFLIVAILVAGDMTVTDLLQIRTYAEEAYLQSVLGEGPASASAVAVPPLLVLGLMLLVGARGLASLEPARFASVYSESSRRRNQPTRLLAVIASLLFVAGFVALPVYGLIWRAGRVGGRATLGQPPVWSFRGFVGSLREATDDSWEPLLTSLFWSAVSATVVMTLAWLLVWYCRSSRFWRVMTLATLVVGLAAPGPVAGMAIKLAYVTTPSIHDTPVILVLGLIIRTLPYAILILWPALRLIPPRAFDIASLAGLGQFGQAMRVGLPYTWRSAWAAWAVAFALAIGELPATNLLLPPGLTTISMRVWTLLHTGVESHLAAVTLVTLGSICLCGLFAIAALQSARSYLVNQRTLPSDSAFW